MPESPLLKLVDRLKKRVNEFEKLVRERTKIDERIEALAEDLGKLGLPTEPLTALAGTVKKKRGPQGRGRKRKETAQAKVKATRKAVAPKKQKKRKWTAADRKKKSEQMKRYWEEKRKQQASQAESGT